MSITFYLRNHTTTIKEENPYFEQSEPEDPIFNPRYHEVDVYHTLNASNINAINMLHGFGFEGFFQDDEGYIGKIPKDKVAAALEEVIKAKGDDVDRYKDSMKRLLRCAVALQDDVVWN